MRCLESGTQQALEIQGWIFPTSGWEAGPGLILQFWVGEVQVVGAVHFRRVGFPG